MGVSHHSHLMCFDILLILVHAFLSYFYMVYIYMHNKSSFIVADVFPVCFHIGQLIKNFGSNLLSFLHIVPLLPGPLPHNRKFGGGLVAGISLDFQ